MEIKIAFKYTEEWIPPRCRKPRPGTFDGETTVHIDEIDDAPVAAIWEHYAGAVEKPQHTTEIRVHDGKFYVLPSGSYNARGIDFCGVAKSVDEIANEIERNLYAWHSLMDNLNTAHELASNHLIIGGKVWWRVSEPIYLVGRTLDYTWVRAEFPDKVSGHDLSKYYNIITPDCEITDKPLVKYDKFDVLMPEVFKRNPQVVYQEMQEFEMSEREKLIKQLATKIDEYDVTNPRHSNEMLIVETGTQCGSSASVRISFIHTKDFSA